MAKNMEVPLLYDYYGDMLTDKQRDMIEQYYHPDLSLSEIAENAGISRQGVRDSVKRAELQLFDMEERLGIVSRIKGIEQSLTTISRYAESIYATADEHGEDAIKNDVSHILSAVSQLKSTIV